MRKLFLAVLASLLTFGLLPVAAAPPDELTDLAQYYPDDMAVFGAIRTDDAYIDTLNGLANRLSQRVPAIPQDFDLRTELFPGMDFENAIRPWLGDTVALGVKFAEDDEPFIALAVADREAAQVFLSGMAANDNLREATVRGGTLYMASDTEFGTSYLLLDDALLAASGGVGFDWLNADVTAPLSDNAEFADVLSRLPEGDYNAIGLMNITTLAPLIMEEGDLDDLATIGYDMNAILGSFGWQAFALTILGERALTMDVATTITDPATLEQAGISLDANQPLNTEFVQNLPADAALVLVGTDIGGGLLTSLSQVEALGDRFEELNQQGELSRSDQSLTFIDDSVTFLRLSIQGLTGASLEEVIGWMTGTYATFLTPGLDADGLPTLETVYLTEATDPAAAEAFVTTWLPNLLRELGLDYIQDEAGVRLPLIGNILENASYDIIASTGDDLLAVGTRASVEFALGAEAGLTTDSTYQAAQAYFLPDTETLAYINFAPLQQPIQALAETERDFQPIAAILPALESASITASYSDDGNGTARLVLTLSE